MFQSLGLYRLHIFHPKPADPIFPIQLQIHQKNPMLMLVQIQYVLCVAGQHKQTLLAHSVCQTSRFHHYSARILPNERSP